jgi:hypothetical protein
MKLLQSVSKVILLLSSVCFYNMLLSCYLNLLKNKYSASLSFSGIRKIFIQDRKNNLKYLKSIKIVLSERLSQNRSPYSKRADLIIKQTS